MSARAHKQKSPLSDDGQLKPHEVVDQKVETIQERNARVEMEKAWETSWTRRLIVTVVTYLAAGFYMQFIGFESPWLGALIPSLAYMLSTLSMPLMRGFWEKFVYKKN